MIVDGGKGPGSLQDSPELEGGKGAAIRVAASRGDMNAWNGSWGIDSRVGNHTKFFRRQLITVSYPDSPGCSYEFVPNAKIRNGPRVPRAAYDCASTPLGVPSFVRIGGGMYMFCHSF